MSSENVVLQNLQSENVVLESMASENAVSQNVTSTIAVEAIEPNDINSCSSIEEGN